MASAPVSSKDFGVPHYCNANQAYTIANKDCLLKRVIINTKGATANTLTLANGAGTFAVIDTTSNVQSLDFENTLCVGGLTATLANGTAANITIIASV